MYLPWAGYFGLVHQADVFVHYDDVQFVRRSWQRRNKIKVPDGEFSWLTVPVHKDHGQRIDEVQINNESDWQEQHWKSIVHSYARTQYFDTADERLRELAYESGWDRLAELDIALVERIADILRFETDFLRSSTIAPAGSKTERLINTLEAVGADTYLSGPAAKDYVELSSFEQAGIDLYWHEFPHPTYPQRHGEFLSHLSIIDMLCHVGAEETGTLIREAEREALAPAFDTD